MTTPPSPSSATGRTLVFGATGQIGAACADKLAGAVTRVARSAPAGSDVLTYDPFGNGGAERDLPDGCFDAVLWAQGVNLSDSVMSFDADRHLEVYKANSLYVALTLSALLSANRLVDGARLCIVSSVWQTVARRDKLSYMMSKAALQGLVMSAAVDLAARGMLINAVLPGAVDTPMTRAHLSPEQIEQVKKATPFGRLAALDDVAAITAFLCSPANTSITGQFIAIDLGFQHARLI